MEDHGKGKKRVRNILALRVSLAVLMIILLVYAAATGQLSSSAPWSSDNKTRMIEQQQAKKASTDWKAALANKLFSKNKKAKQMLGFFNSNAC